MKTALEVIAGSGFSVVWQQQWRFQGSDGYFDGNEREDRGGRLAAASLTGGWLGDRRWKAELEWEDAGGFWLF